MDVAKGPFDWSNRLAEFEQRQNCVHHVDVAKGPFDWSDRLAEVEQRQNCTSPDS